MFSSFLSNEFFFSADRLSEAEIKKMLSLAEEFAEQDRIARETVEWRNHLEAFAFNVKNKINEAEVRVFQFPIFF